MEKLFIKIKGITPLLMNNPQYMGNPGPLPVQEEEVKRSRYVDKDENLLLPSVALRKSIILGATGYKIGKFSLKSRLSASITIFEEFFNILDEKGNYKKDYVTDSRRVVIKATKAGVIRSRARVEIPWYVEGIYGFNSEMLMDKYGAVQMEALEKAINIAGQVAGLLDYRPNRDGWFGKYELIDIEVLQ